MCAEQALKVTSPWAEAFDPRTQPARLAAMAARGWAVVGVAANPNTPLDVLAACAHAEDRHLRVEVLKNPALPADLVLVAFDERDQRVRAGAAAHPNCPPELLERLAGDPRWPVRAAVAGNVNAPEGALRALAADAEWEVRATVAGHPGAPLDVRLALLCDRSRQVSEGAARVLPVEEAVAVFTGPARVAARRAVAGWRAARLGGSVARALFALGGDEGVLARVAWAQVSEDPGALAVLAEDLDERVRVAARWRLLELT